MVVLPSLVTSKVLITAASSPARQKFSKVSALIHLLYKVAKECTFENGRPLLVASRQTRRGVGARVAPHGAGVDLGLPAAGGTCAQPLFLGLGAPEALPEDARRASSAPGSLAP